MKIGCDSRFAERHCEITNTFLFSKKNRKNFERFYMNVIPALIFNIFL